MFSLPVAFKVIANQKENISPVGSISMGPPSQAHNDMVPRAANASSGPPSQARNGMVTRATNASKHPGFLALDDEDLNSMQKKKEAASRRQAKAAEKKFLEARLVANTNRIAAFEDVLSIQHADKIANAARPTTRASQVKATKAQPAEPVSDVSESVPADRDHVPENPNQELVESEASRADDADYAPSSEGESERLTVCGNLTYYWNASFSSCIQDANGNDEKVPSTGPKYRCKGAKCRDA
jgi:hypothetical protein